MFVPSRKNVISVSGFYKTMKKASHVNANVSMDCDSPGQVTVFHSEAKVMTDRNRKEESEPLGVDSPNADHNVRPNVSTHIVTNPATQCDDNQCEDNCVIIRDVTPTTDSDKKIKGLNTQLKDVDDELDKCDSVESLHLIFYGPKPRASSTFPNSTQFNKAREATTRVFVFSTKLRVLPTWTRRPRIENSNSNPSLRSNIGQKRNSPVTLDHANLPSKQQQVYLNDGVDFFELVEADHQPR